MIASQKSHSSQHVGSVKMTWSKEPATILTNARERDQDEQGAARPADATPGAGTAEASVASLQGCRRRSRGHT